MFNLDKNTERICESHKKKATTFCVQCHKGLCNECEIRQIYSQSAGEGLPYCKECYDRTSERVSFYRNA